MELESEISKWLESAREPSGLIESCCSGLGVEVSTGEGALIQEAVELAIPMSQASATKFITQTMDALRERIQETRNNQ